MGKVIVLIKKKEIKYYRNKKREIRIYRMYMKKVFSLLVFLNFFYFFRWYLPGAGIFFKFETSNLKKKSEESSRLNLWNKKKYINNYHSYTTYLYII